MRGLKALFIMLLGLMISFGAIGFEVNGGDLVYSLIALIIGGALMYYSLFILVRL